MEKLRAPCRYLHLRVACPSREIQESIFFLTRLEDWRVRFLQSPLLDPTVEAEVVFRIQWEARERRRLHHCWTRFETRFEFEILKGRRTRALWYWVLQQVLEWNRKNYPKNFQYSYSSVVVLLKFIGINSTVYI